MHNSLTHQSHSPSNTQEEFLLKILKLETLSHFIRVVSLPFLQNNTTSPKVERKRKNPLASWKSHLIYAHENKSVEVPFITKNSKHLFRTICSHMKNKSVKLPFVTKNSKHFVGKICSHMKNKSVKLPFITKNSKHLVRTICSHMKNKSVKLQFVTKNSKHFVGTICSRMKNKSVKLPFVTKTSKHLAGASGDDVWALIEFTPL